MTGVSETSGGAALEAVTELGRDVAAKDGRAGIAEGRGESVNFLSTVGMGEVGALIVSLVDSWLVREVRTLENRLVTSA